MIHSYVLNEKSSKLKNYFSSPNAGLTKIYSNIDTLLNEQRNQRSDLAALLRMATKIINEIQLYKQADEYYQTKLEDNTHDIPEEK